MRKASLFLFALFYGLCLWAPVAHAQIDPITEIFEPQSSNYPADKFGKVAVVQWAMSGSILPGPAATEAYAEAIKEGARRHLENYIREAARNGAKLVVTPEFAILGYPDIPNKPPEEDEFQTPEEIAPYVEPVPAGPSSRFFSALAKELKIYLHIGLAEVDQGSGKYYNTVVAFNPDGDVVAKYRKSNLFNQENDFLSPGLDPGFYSSPWGEIGIVICADVYSNFPLNIYRQLKFPVIAVSTSWAHPNSGMAAFTNAAVQQNAYVLAANQIYFPDSGVINPDGSAQSHIRQSTGVAYGYLPLKSAPTYPLSIKTSR